MNLSDATKLDATFEPVPGDCMIGLDRYNKNGEPYVRFMASENLFRASGEGFFLEMPLRKFLSMLRSEVSFAELGVAYDVQYKLKRS